jgi:hypothetical protein
LGKVRCRLVEVIKPTRQSTFLLVLGYTKEGFCNFTIVIL